MICNHFYRAEHSNGQSAYSCVPCQARFGTWRNFKRHNLEKHSASGRYKCQFCCYKTNRNETLKRHIKAKHRGAQIVSSLISDILNELPVEDINPVSIRVVKSLMNDIVEELPSVQDTSDEETIPAPTAGMGPCGDINVPVESLGRFACQPCARSFRYDYCTYIVVLYCNIFLQLSTFIFLVGIRMF